VASTSNPQEEGNLDCSSAIESVGTLLTPGSWWWGVTYFVSSLSTEKAQYYHKGLVNLGIVPAPC